MKYRLFVSDFDGTALRSDRTVSPLLARAIKDYESAGGTFVISSGRMFESIVAHACLLGLDDADMPICAQDGGVIKTLSGKEIAITTMPKSDVLDFALECERSGLYFQVYSKDTLFVEKANEFNLGYCNVSKIGMREVGKLSDFIAFSDEQFVKVLHHGDAEWALEHFKDRYEGIRFFLSSATFLDGASVNAGKGNALIKLCAYLNLGIENTVAIGDSMNDISMVEAACVGAAVANADDRLKAKAKLIVPSNDDDGVAKLLYMAINDEI